MAFTHLHVHTEYSLLDGSNKIKDYVDRVKELGMDSCAITDHGVMYGVIDFYKYAKSQGIKPIIGCEVYVAATSATDRSKNKYYHLVLLAENNEGYSNLMKLVSYGFVQGYYYKPRIDKEILKKYSKGLIATSACLQGEVSNKLLYGSYEQAKKAALEYEEIMGKNNFFLELQYTGVPEQLKVNEGLIDLSKELGIDLVATNDVHYTMREDCQAHDVLLCIQTGKKLNDRDRMRYPGDMYYVKSEEEMREHFYYIPEAIENTHKIAERCNVDIEFHKLKLPRFDVPQGFTALEYLNHLCNEGLVKRYGENVSDELKNRLKEEIDTISGMGFVEYFLIVWDFINFAKQKGIAVGPGRGSAAGSIVSYCLGITDIDPIEYNLIFERFLNPERVSMPDIDIDFCYERRPEVIDYVIRKYGEKNVVQIITFGTMAARGVIKDVARVMDIPYAKADKLAKMVPSEPGMTIDLAITQNPELKTAIETDSETETLITMARKLEGLPRHTSIHAAGVVICGAEADSLVPLAKNSDGIVTTQYVMTTIEELGLLKMDFLGLRTLTVIQKACKYAGIKVSDINNFNDPAVFDLISSGKTDGVFQLESKGMKSFMQTLKPRNIEDIIAGISLYRPGPMDFIPEYIKGKNNSAAVTYACPQLKPILESTYGCIVYQEQVMQIVRNLAGYSLGRSDLVRRAMSKKKQDVMEAERKNFVYGNEAEGIKGCVNNGIDAKIANEIYDKMIDFAKYAFNKSHAAAYAVVAYETAYLKCHYKVEFMCALLSSVIDNSDKLKAYLYSCREEKIKLIPPNINLGGRDFRCIDGQIVFALDSVKGVGGKVAEEIEKERMANGDYKDFDDFIKRLSYAKLNKKTLESLIKSGAFDSLGYKRRQLLEGYMDVMDFFNEIDRDSIHGQVSLFDMFGEEEERKASIKLPDVPEFAEDVLLSMEKEVTGIYLSGHPLDSYEELLKKNVTNIIADFIPESEGVFTVKNAVPAVIGGIITGKIVRYTKKGRPMAIIQLEDPSGTMEVVFFPNQYERYITLLNENEKVIIWGRTDISDETRPAKLLAESMELLDGIHKDLWIMFENSEVLKEKFQELCDILKEYPGNGRVTICIKDTKTMKEYKKYRVDSSDILIEVLKKHFGDEAVKTSEKKLAKV